VNTRNEQKTAPIKPYDESMWENWSMYDNLPYIRDLDLRADKTLAIESGNVIKSYRCQIKEPYEVKH
jgi:hypothetical protein